MKKTWVQDSNTTEVLSVMMKMIESNKDYIHKTGSKYITGRSKSGKSNDVGIYFVDPTANEKER